MKNKRIFKNQVLEKNIDLEDDINNVIEKLLSINEKYGDKYSKIYIERDYFNDPCDYVVMAQRLETDTEYETRVRDEEVRKNEILEKERKQYEALKAKFDKN